MSLGGGQDERDVESLQSTPSPHQPPPHPPTTTPHPSSTRTLHTATTRPCQGGDKKGGVVVPPKALMVPPLILPSILNVECLWAGDRTSATSNHSNPPLPLINALSIPLTHTS